MFTFLSDFAFALFSSVLSSCSCGEQLVHLLVDRKENRLTHIQRFQNLHSFAALLYRLFSAVLYNHFYYCPVFSAFISLLGTLLFKRFRNYTTYCRHILFNLSSSFFYHCSLSSLCSIVIN